MLGLGISTMTVLALASMLLGAVALGCGLVGAIKARKRRTGLRTVTVMFDDEDRSLCRHCRAYQRFDSRDPTCWLCNRRLDGSIDAETRDAPQEAS